MKFVSIRTIQIVQATKSVLNSYGYFIKNITGYNHPVKYMNSSSYLKFMRKIRKLR